MPEIQFREALRQAMTEEMEREYRELAETLKSESPRGRRKQIGFAVAGGPREVSALAASVAVRVLRRATWRTNPVS